MKTAAKTLCLVGFFFLLSANYEGNCQSSFNVNVKVVAETAGIRETIKSYVNRELRSLGDVVLVDSLESFLDLGLYISAMKINLEDGRSVGYSLSAIAVYAVYSGETDEAPDKIYYDSNLLLTDKEGLKEICERIVVWYDIGLIETFREIQNKN